MLFFNKVINKLVIGTHKTISSNQHSYYYQFLFANMTFDKQSTYNTSSVLRTLDMSTTSFIFSQSFMIISYNYLTSA